MNKIDKLRDLHLFFLQRVKPRKPVILRICNMKHLHGVYYYHNKKHLIIINKRDNLETMYDNLTHEVAHMLQRNKIETGCCIKDHTDEWGKCYAKAYRIYIEWLSE